MTVCSFSKICIKSYNLNHSFSLFLNFITAFDIVSMFSVRWWGAPLYMDSIGEGGYGRGCPFSTKLQLIFLTMFASPPPGSVGSSLLPSKVAWQRPFIFANMHAMGKPKPGTPPSAPPRTPTLSQPTEIAGPRHKQKWCKIREKGNPPFFSSKIKELRLLTERYQIKPTTRRTGSSGTYPVTHPTGPSPSPHAGPGPKPHPQALRFFPCCLYAELRRISLVFCLPLKFPVS